METGQKKKYEKRTKIVLRKGFYYCIEDEGNGTGKCRLDYKNKSRKLVLDHQNQTHYKTERRKAIGRVASRKMRAKTNLTSYVTNRIATNEPLLPILDYNSDSDWEDDVSLQVRLDLAMIDAAEEKKYAENHSPYNANAFVSYIPENPDIGPEETYALRNEELEERESGEMTEEERKKYTFSFYFGSTHSNHDVCQYLEDSTKTKGTSRLIQLMNAGQIVWRKDFSFSGGTSEQNKNDAMMWQHFYKNINQYKQMSAKDPDKVESVILNGGLQRKSFFKGVLSKEDKGRAKRIAWQNRPFIPLPSHLLQQDPEDADWIKHEQKVKGKRGKKKYF